VGLLTPERRAVGPEWMDREDNGRADLAPCLLDLRRVNRFLGGHAVLLRALRPHFDRTPPGATLRLLDVGTGDGDHPRAIVHEARRRGVRVRVRGVDRDPVIVELAREACAAYPEIEIDVADATALPVPDGAFDLVTASLFLHHFDGDAALRVLTELSRVARTAVLVNDLRRHRVPWAFTTALAGLRVLSVMSRNDGPLSVLKGFTDDELLALGRKVSARAAVRRGLGYRLLLEIPRS
jgi:ubiquinone/menaquinone biosynthesis C-methylase UbiE